MKSELRYCVQETGDNFRVTDTRTDSRVATCYLRTSADLVVRALNALKPECVTVQTPDETAIYIS